MASLLINKNILFKIYSGDYTSTGYNIGINRAKSGMPKYHFGVITNRHFLNNIWKFQDSINSYYEGYNKGYDIGLRLKEGVYHPIQVNNVIREFSVSNIDRYDSVISGLYTAKNNVKLNIQQLESSLASYSRQIEAMQNVGFLEDYTNKLKAYNGLEMRINGLKSFLMQISVKIEEIENHIRQLRSDSNN